MEVPEPGERKSLLPMAKRLGLSGLDALDELDHVQAAGARFGAVLADAGDGDKAVGTAHLPAIHRTIDASTARNGSGCRMI